MLHRPRRLRVKESIRSMVRETSLNVSDFVYPMFVVEGGSIRDPIDTMPGQFRYSVDELVKECHDLVNLGIHAVNLFGYMLALPDCLSGSNNRIS